MLGQEKETSRSDVTLHHAYMHILHSKMSYILFISVKKKNPPLRQKKMTKEYTSQPTCWMLHLLTWRVCSRQVLHQRPLPVLPWATKWVTHCATRAPVR